jgi:hypothetical protein
MLISQAVSTSLYYLFPGNGFITQEILKVSLNHTLPISLYYSTYKVFKSHVKSSQADLLFSFALLKLIACLLYSSLLPYFSSLLLYSGRFLLQLKNSAHLYRRGTDTDLQKTSHDCYRASPLARWLDLQKTRHMIANHCCDVIEHTQAAGNRDNTAPVLLAVCVLRALPSNGFTSHNI